jgi:hypothetical protein
MTPRAPSRRCREFRPDHNGECLNCDEPLDAHGGLCGRCAEDAEVLVPAPCEERPTAIRGPLGTHYCPGCGVMMIDGFPHPWVCLRCAAEIDP